MPMRHYCVAALGLGGAPVAGLGGITIPSLSSLPLPDVMIDRGHDQGAAGLAQCDVLPSGWPTELDWGIYWFGPNGESKKAKPRARTETFDPRTWFYTDKRNATKDWNEDFYDPSRNTVIYMHGDSESGAFSPAQCSRVSPRCRAPICPEGVNQSLVDPWIRKGWNVGFFYWDQFADKPGKACNLDTERRIWFDRDGDGLHWGSYPTGPQDSNVGSSWRPFNGTESTVTELCVSAVKQAMGDFYSGSTVRFVGRSIGAQLAVACAAELHHEGHVAAPQRLTLLDPLFTSADYTFFGTAFQCDSVQKADSVGDYAREATANFVKMLWVRKKVVTEVFVSNGVDKQLKGPAIQEMRKYSVWVMYKASWCIGNSQTCEHRAVFPLYFLSFNKTSRVVSGRQEIIGPCTVPAASCTDAQIRALVEVQLKTLSSQDYAQIPNTRWVWTQMEGSNTFNWSDDTFALQPKSADADVGTATPNPSIEDEVSMSAAISQRDWGLSRGWRLGGSAGASLQQLQVGLWSLVGVIIVLLIPVVASLAYRSVRFAYDKLGGQNDDDEDGQEEEEEELTSSCAEETDSFMP